MKVLWVSCVATPVAALALCVVACDTPPADSGALTATQATGGSLSASGGATVRSNATGGSAPNANTWLVGTTGGTYTGGAPNTFATTTGGVNTQGSGGATGGTSSTGGMSPLCAAAPSADAGAVVAASPVATGWDHVCYLKGGAVFCWATTLTVSWAT